MVQKFSTWYFDSEMTFEQIEAEIRKNCRTIGLDDASTGFEDFTKGTVDVDGTQVEYLSGIAKHQYLKKGWENKLDEDQMVRFIEKFLIYKEGKQIKLVVLGSKTASEKIIKKVFLDDRFEKISEENNIEKDILYWFVYRVREFAYKEAMPNSNIFFTGLEGYMGKTSDNINSVRGQGIRVMALMNTLAFIFNDEDLKSLRPKIQYKDTVLTVEFNSNNSNRIIIQNENEYSIKTSLLVCKVIIPKLIEAYKHAIENKTWSPQIKLTFLTMIGNDINDKVVEQLNKIESDIKKLNCVDECEDECENECEESFQDSFEFEFDEDDDI